MKIQCTKAVLEKIVEMHDSALVGTLLFSVLWELQYYSEYVFEEELVNDARKFRLEKDNTKRIPEKDDMFIFGSIINMIFEERAKRDYRIREIPPVIREKCAILCGKYFKEFSAKEFMSNPYFSKLNLPKARSGNFELTTKAFEKYELQTYDVLAYERAVHMAIPRMCFFKERYEYPIIMENKGDGSSTTWMTITPNEIFTMRKPIEEAKGKILVLGCGLGYYAYMISLKENVDDITIIEKEKSVIELFERFILPQFEFKNKIKIIHADAFNYMKTVEDGMYDYCFADIWDGVTETETYYHMKAICRRFKKMKLSYWIEDGFILSLRDILIARLAEKSCKIMGIDSFDNVSMPYSNGGYHQKFADAVLGKMVIKTPKDVEDCLEPGNILKAVNKLKIY